MKKIYIILAITIILLLSFKGSFAQTEPLDLNENNFEQKVKNYIDIIDDYLIPNTTYEISNILNENYDFLVNFSLSYINNNKDKYEIIKKNNEEYINIDEIYKITNKIFGQKYFIILNQEIDNNLIKINKKNETFKMKISNIEIKNYDVYIKYEEINLKYIYQFKKNDNNLVLYNVGCEK